MVSTNYNYPIALLLSFLLSVIAAVAAASTGDGQNLKVELKFELEVEDLTQESYTEFIEHLRRRLAASYSHYVPVLPVNDPSLHHLWFDIVLQKGENHITLRANRRNLYIQGYRMRIHYDRHHRHRWFEFPNEGHHHLIDDSHFLKFYRSYNSMTSAGHCNLLTMQLNLKAFKDAVTELATGMEEENRAHGLVVMAQMISEATRFINISHHFATAGKNETLPEWMEMLERDWESYSTKVLKADASPCYEYVPVTINGDKKETVGKLSEIFGMLVRDPDTLPPWPPCLMLSNYSEPLQNNTFRSQLTT